MEDKCRRIKVSKGFTRLGSLFTGVATLIPGSFLADAVISLEWLGLKTVALSGHMIDVDEGTLNEVVEDGSISTQSQLHTMAKNALGTRIGAMTVVGSMILRVAAIIASWPATSFLIMYYDDPQNTGALVARGVSFLCLQLLCGVQRFGVG